MALRSFVTVLPLLALALAAPTAKLVKEAPSTSDLYIPPPPPDGPIHWKDLYFTPPPPTKRFVPESDHDGPPTPPPPIGPGRKPPNHATRGDDLHLPPPPPSDGNPGGPRRPPPTKRFTPGDDLEIPPPPLAKRCPGGDLYIPPPGCPGGPNPRPTKRSAPEDDIYIPPPSPTSSSNPGGPIRPPPPSVGNPGGPKRPPPTKRSPGDDLLILPPPPREDLHLPPPPPTSGNNPESNLHIPSLPLNKRCPGGDLYIPPPGCPGGPNPRPTKRSAPENDLYITPPPPTSGNYPKTNHYIPPPPPADDASITSPLVSRAAINSNFAQQRNGVGSRVTGKGTNWYKSDLGAGNGGFGDSQHYACHSGGAGNFPGIGSWMKFNDMWNRNKRISNVRNDIRDAIVSVSKDSGVDARLILAIVMQESTGNVNVGCTGNGNCGLMQAYPGSVSYDPGNAKASIRQMIVDGTQGTSQGPGLVQWYNNQGVNSNANGNPYNVARGYNSGSINLGNLNDGKGATASYVSDIANRLQGWDGRGSQRSGCGF